eukprot:c3581_g1_i1.p1 GENE.c3581_g1_i1~~c3581_g1_i1.p1  ORF type:complete len:233 (-),score=70.93 c3581_g1_i1:90-737(-)
MTKEKIHQLLATQRFSDQTIAPLEQYLKQQVDTSSVDSEALLALLKLYALYPGKSNNVHTATILAKLLTTLPSTDFQTALCLIPLRIQQDALIAPLVEMGDSLESCHFSAFWERRPAATVCDKVPSFDDAIRKHILSVVSRTSTGMSAEVLSLYLGVSEAGLQSIVAASFPQASTTSISFPQSAIDHGNHHVPTTSHLSQEQMQWMLRGVVSSSV